jgi:hypothetical protein
MCSVYRYSLIRVISCTTFILIRLRCLSKAVGGPGWRIDSVNLIDGPKKNEKLKMLRCLSKAVWELGWRIDSVDLIDGSFP